MSGQRPLPIPPYPGVIPYTVDRRDKEDGAGGQTGGRDSSPRLLAMEQRPVSVGSFGPPSTQTVPGLASSGELSEEQLRDKFYAYWNRQKERHVWVPSDGHQYLARDHAVTESQSGSQATLLSPKVKRERWPRGSDFLGATTSFTLSLHGLWMLPVAVMQHGGVTFLLMYTVMLIILGGPLLLLEVSLGQYSGLAPGPMFRHLCPLLAGLGLSVCLQAAVRALLDLGVLMWSALTLYSMFSGQVISDGFFHRDILGRDTEDNLESLGELGGRQVLVLSVVSVSVFLVTVLGTRVLGKLGLLTVPVTFMLLVSLVIRACLAGGGTLGILTLLAPDWAHLTSPASWMVAVAQVVFSLQLGLGSVSAYASYNSYHHNIVRDTVIMIASNLVWAVLSILLVFSLLGITHSLQTINLTHVLASEPGLSVSITGSGLLMAGVTMVETALASVATGWLWAGLLFLLIFLTTLTSLTGLLETISSSIISLRPSLLRYKPAITFSVLTFLFLLALVLGTGGGAHVYSLLDTFIASWPSLLTSLLGLLASLACHGPQLLLASIIDMSQVRLHHVIISHLSVLFTSVSPVLLLASLGYQFHILASEHLTAAVTTLHLPLPEWAVSTGWSLALVPTSPIIFGSIVYLVWANRGVPRMANVVTSLRSTERWHRAARIELDSGNRRTGQNTSTA